MVVRMEALVIFFAVAISSIQATSLTIDPESEESTYTLNQGENLTLTCRGDGDLMWTRQNLLRHDEQDLGYRTRRERDGTVLELYDVNEHAVGYYACHRADVRVDLDELMAEPLDSEDVRYVYVFVNGSNTLADTRTSIPVKENTTFVIPCRPTMPDLEVKLHDRLNGRDVMSEEYFYNPKIGFVLLNGATETSDFGCKSDVHENILEVKLIEADDLEEPVITKDPNEWMPNTRGVGETWVVNCTVVYKNSPLAIIWRDQNGEQISTNETNRQRLVPEGGVVFNTLKIDNLRLEDAGTYTCVVTYGHTHKTKDITLKVTEPYEDEVTINGGPKQYKEIGRRAKWRIVIPYYPEPHITIEKEDGTKIYDSNSNFSDTTKYTVVKGQGIISFEVLNTTLEDSGNYTVFVNNKPVQRLEVFVQVKPHAKLPDSILDTSRRYLKVPGRKQSFECFVSGNPLPTTKWTFKPDCDSCPEEHFKETSTKKNPSKRFEYNSVLDLELMSSGNLSCVAENFKYNPIGGTKTPQSSSSSAIVLLYEVESGMAVRGEEWAASGEDVQLSCLASKYDYQPQLTWTRNGKKIHDATSGVSKTALSHVRTLTLKRATSSDSGEYECTATLNNGTQVTRTHRLTVEDSRPALIERGLGDGELQARENLPLQLNCTAEGVPRPTFRWFHNDVELTSDVTTEPINYTLVRSVLRIPEVTRNELGLYRCRASNDYDESHSVESYVQVVLKETGVKPVVYLSAIGAMFLVFLMVATFLFCKWRKEKRKRKEYEEAFLKGSKLDENLCIDQQADKLPYDPRYEFPPEKIHFLNVRLGQGAFGEVYKATARGIIDAEKETIVAVKKVKPNAEPMYVEALASELKIMQQVGAHINVLRLLGACTKKIAKRELMVILEYCKYGNLHKYILTHKYNYRDFLTGSRHFAENGQYNRGFSISGEHSDPNYYGGSRTPGTGETTLSVADTAHCRTGSESECWENNWRSNYDGYAGGGERRDLTSHDLLAWAFQVALGMEFLGKKKILHGDLAARNLLLAEDNIVKICDFGLARKMQTDYQYKKESNDPVPVKWLAPESMKRGTYSTQSDVWAFGVVMWEFFSLARTPYPNVRHTELLELLDRGERLPHPKHANDALYELMRACWHENPAQRPTFTTLQRDLKEMLDKNEKERFDHLHQVYEQMSATGRWRPTDNEYLEHVQAPTYLPTSPLPTPNYANGEIRTGTDGYLLPTPRYDNRRSDPNQRSTRFVFPPVPEVSNEEVEMTPMLPADPAYLQIREDDDVQVFQDSRDNPSYHAMRNSTSSDQTDAPHSYVNIINKRRV